MEPRRARALRETTSELRDPVLARELREAHRVSRLVTLLQSRSDLRGVYGPADLVDQAVRWSA
jgi:hypothetical protein